MALTYSRTPSSIAQLSSPGAKRWADRLPSLRTKSEGSDRGAVAAYIGMSRAVRSVVLLLAAIMIGGGGAAALPGPAPLTPTHTPPAGNRSRAPPAHSRAGRGGAH